MWWNARKEELARLARESGPVLVYDGETLNEIVFDVCAMEGVDVVLFDLGLSVHSDLVGAVSRLGAGFVWRSEGDLGRLPRHVRGNLDKGVFRPHSSEGRVLLEPVPDGCLTAIPAKGPVPGGLKGLEGRDVLLVLSEPAPLRPGSPEVTRLRDLDRCGARFRGVFLSWGTDVADREAGDALQGWKAVPPGDGMLVAGRGWGLAFDGTTGRLDPLVSGERVLALKDELPGWRLWLEPGPRFFSPAGALVVPIEGKPPKVMPWPGPSGMETLLESEGLKRVEERFLNARRICPVPL